MSIEKFKSLAEERIHALAKKRKRLAVRLYVNEIGKLKDAGLKWAEIAKVVNDAAGCDISADDLRKNYSFILKSAEKGRPSNDNAGATVQQSSVPSQPVEIAIPFFGFFTL